MTASNFLSAIWERSLAAFAAMAIASLLSSCAHLEAPEEKVEPEPPVAEKKPPPEPIKPPPRSRLYEWYGSDDYVSRIEVSIDEQKARFYSGDKEVGWTTVASGVHRYPTPVGTFAVLEKVQNKKSNLYGKIYNKNGKLVKRNAKMGVDSIPEGGHFRGAPMPYFLRLTNDGIGMHAGPIPRPGNRASHGCIRMPKKFAPVLYRYVDVGTSVTIKGNGPSYARYLVKQRKSAPKPAPAKVAHADLAPAADLRKPASATPGDSAGTQPTAASGTAVAAPQPTDVAAPDAAGASVVAHKAGADQAFPSSAPTPAAASPAPEATQTPALPTGKGAAADVHVSPKRSGGQQMAPAETAFPPAEAEATVKSEG